MKRSRDLESPSFLQSEPKPTPAFTSAYMKELKKADTFESFGKLLHDLKFRNLHVSDMLQSVKVLFEGREDLILGFNAFLPKNYRISITDDADDNVDQGEEETDETNMDLGEEETEMSNGDLGEEKTEKSNGDLGEEETVEINGRFGEYLDFAPYLIGGVRNHGILFVRKVMDKLQSSDSYKAFLRRLHLYSEGRMEKHKLFKDVADLLGDHTEIVNQLDDFLKLTESTGFFVNSKKARKATGKEDKEKICETGGIKEKKGKEKYMDKSIQDLDLYKTKRCTHSYRLLPEDYPIPVSSHRTELDSQVLNDRYVSVSSRGKEDYSDRKKRNPSDEILFECEDDMYELDMLLESVKATIKDAELILNGGDETGIGREKPPIRFFRCIERVYGEQGLEVIEMFRENRIRALPVILSRLNQKQEKLLRYKSDCNKVWAEVIAKHSKK